MIVDGKLRRWSEMTARCVVAKDEYGKPYILGYTHVTRGRVLVFYLRGYGNGAPRI